MLEKISANELIEKWIRFFTGKNHLDISNLSVIPHSSDRSLLFINSGVAAIKAYFYGDLPAPCNRLVSCQKVIRTGDIDSIGDSVRHHTYFEMLGNFSIGDYFKKEAIEWAWEFLTKELRVSPDNLIITVFEGDEEAYKEWRKWVSDGKIVKCSRKTNFWDMGVGPCGSCSEIYFDRGEDVDSRGAELLKDDIDNERYLEIWNIVFSEFLNVDGRIIEAPTKNIDTGAGLERLLTILENKFSNFENSLFTPIIEYLESKSSLKNKDLWAVSDYLRTTCLLLSEGIIFGNKGRSYVLRRIFRKSINTLRRSNLNKEFFNGIVEVIGNTLPYHPEILNNREFIVNSLLKEVKIASETYLFSSKCLSELLDKYKEIIPEEEIFNLITRYGLDLGTIKGILKENNRSFNKNILEELIDKHRKISFNTSISSAFIKKIPSLLNLEVSSNMDYDNERIKSVINAVFNEGFERTDSIDGVGYLVLENTTVFPLSGGQDSDDGWINDSIIDESLKAPNGQILHRIEGNYRIGEIVEVRHDVNRRKNLSIHHTLEHIFYELLKRKIHKDIERESGQKHENYFMIEVSTPGFIEKKNFNIKSLNRELNEIVGGNLRVKINYIDLKKSKELGLSQRFEEVYKKSSERLRLVDIGDYSRELCAGTHVKNTSEIGECLITEFKKKQGNTYRFRVVGGRENIDRELINIGKKRNKKINRENIWESKEEDSSGKREEFNREKKRLMEELLSMNEVLIRKEVDSSLALQTFKELRSRLNSRTIFLISNDRYYVISDVIDVSKLLEIFKNKYGWKGGGNAGFGSGMISKEVPDNTIIQHLKAYFN